MAEEDSDAVPMLVEASAPTLPAVAAAPTLPKVPLTILSGFLGAGKTTLLAGLLRQEHGKRVAVVQNERGMTLGAEQALAISNAATQEWLELANGCVCCTVKDDLLLTLEQLLRRSQAQGVPFDHIVLETSGLADPAPLLEVFWVDAELESQVYLDAVVTVCDARHIAEHLQRTREAPQQVAYADRILLNKCDLVDEAVLADAEARIRHVNQSAPVQRTTFSQVPLHELVGIQAFDPLRAAQQVEEARARGRAQSAVHSDDIATLNIRVAGTLDKQRVKQALAAVLWADPCACDVLRLKGVLALRGKSTLYSLQCVRKVWALDKTPLRRGDSDDAFSHVVIIGRGVAAVDWHKLFADCVV